MSKNLRWMRGQKSKIGNERPGYDTKNNENEEDKWRKMR